MNIHFIENDTAQANALRAAFQKAFPDATPNWTVHTIQSAPAFETCRVSLAAEAGCAIGLHDLKLDLTQPSATPLFKRSGLRDNLFTDAIHGVELLMTLATASKGTGKEVLLVVASTFCGDRRWESLRRWVNGLSAWNVVLTKVGEGFSSNPAVADDAALIAKLWNDCFGCMANRVRASYTKGWFDDGLPHPVMRHSIATGKQIPDTARLVLGEWMSRVLRISYSEAEALLNGLKIAEAPFYNHVPRHLCGACALHSGRTAGEKPLNMHALAFLACAYASNVADVFKSVSWQIPGSARLIPDNSSVQASEELLYLLVGQPDHALDAGGLLGLLGVDTGQGGGTVESRTIDDVCLKERNVTISFAFDATVLVAKLNRDEEAGGAARAVMTTKRVLAPHVAVTWVGDNKHFKLSFTKV